MSQVRAARQLPALCPIANGNVDAPFLYRSDTPSILFGHGDNLSEAMYIGC
jgi:hypothetical protein